MHREHFNLNEIRQKFSLTSLEKGSDVFRPFSSQPIGSSQTTISTADYERIDTVSDQVEGSFTTTFDFPEFSATSSSDQSTSNTSESSNIIPSNLTNRQFIS